MPSYDFRCPAGHISGLVQQMSLRTPEAMPCDHPGCELNAKRVFDPPAAIVFKGPGFYSTDVKGRVERRRRPNPGSDRLTRVHDPVAHDIAKRA